MSKRQKLYISIVHRLYPLFVLLLLAAAACKKDSADVDGPVLIAGSDLNGASFDRGASYQFSITATDNRALRDLRVRWAHRTAGIFDSTGLTPWEEELNQPVSGTEQQQSFGGVVPANAQPGSYRLEATATDQSGNRSLTLVRDFTVENSQNPTPPVLTLTRPAASGATVAAGTNLLIDGLGSDDTGLRMVAIRLERTSAPGIGSVLTEFRRTVFNNPRLQAVNETIPIPATQAPGDLLLSVLVIDQHDNTFLVQRTIRIL